MLASCGRASCASGRARGRRAAAGREEAARPRPPSPWPDCSKGAKMAGRIGVHLGNRCELLRPHSFRDRQCPSAFSPLHISSSFAIILLEGLQKTIPHPSHATESNRPCLFHSTGSVVGLSVRSVWLVIGFGKSQALLRIFGLHR